MKLHITAAALLLSLVSCGQKTASLQNYETPDGYVIPYKEGTITLRKVSPAFFLMGQTFDQGLVRNPVIRGVMLDGYAIGTEEMGAGMTWNDAQKFVKKLSQSTGIAFRLPTEAEWEYAARTDASMPGGLWEWCSDRWADDPPQQLLHNPEGPDSGNMRVLKGGSKADKEQKPSTRKVLEPYIKSPAVAFRLAVSTGEKLQGEWPELLLENKQVREPQDVKAETFTVNGVKFRMMPVEGGSFRMGATSGKNINSAGEDEFPVHEVTLDNYKLGEFEVTSELWKAVMGSLPPQIRDGKYPVCNVSWYDAQLFIGKLNSLTGRKFRLPTEAEWEYAAKGGLYTHDFCFSGSDQSLSVSWHEMENGKTREAGNRSPNELGIYDMSGNAWEWVQDRPGPYSEDAQVNPTGPTEARDGADLRVIRGGSVSGKWSACRVSNRGENFAYQFKSTIGFRLAL